MCRAHCSAGSLASKPSIAIQVGRGDKLAGGQRDRRSLETPTTAKVVEDKLGRVHKIRTVTKNLSVVAASL